MTFLAFAIAATLHKPVAQTPDLQSEYAKKIAEFTTEPFFLTDWVDHLPIKAGLKSPLEFFGHISGAPNVLSYSTQLAEYYRVLERSSKRIKVISLGRSEEGREMVAAVISDEENLARLDDIKKANALLSDPRKLSGAAGVDTAIRNAMPIYWATGGMHAPESGPPEMLGELAYRLIASDKPEIKAIRKNSIIMLTPVLDVDGRDRVVDLYMARKKNPQGVFPSLIYWGNYVAHDDNRDAIGMSLQLSKSIMRTWLEYHPTVFHDLHESVPYLYISTGTGPYNPWLDPITISEWQEMAYNEIQGMTLRGVPGVWTHGFYDGWAPSYGFYVANGHNGVGRFYETFSGGGADTGIRSAGDTTKEWFRPNPPFPQVRWSVRNNVNLSQSALLMGMYKVATERDKFLRNLYTKTARSIAKAKTEGPVAYVIRNSADRQYEASRMVRLMQLQGVEVSELSGPTKVGEVNFAKGDYVIRMDQPYSRMADMLLDSQFYKATDPRSYDDTGWQLGPLFDLGVTRVKDPALLEAPMSLTGAKTETKVKLPAQSPRVAYVHTWTSTQDEGWGRIALDEMGVPYKYVSIHELRDTVNLKAKYDVIILPQTGGTGQSIVRGIPKVGKPIAWQRTKEMPNLGGPDSTDDIRGGIELEGVGHLKKFVEDGGKLVAIGNMCRIPVDFALVTGVSIVEPKELNAPGGVFKLDLLEKDSVVAKGYHETTGAYFNSNTLPMLQLGGGFGGGRGRPDTSGRASGRGSLTDPDVVQGRPPYTPKAKPGDTPAGGGQAQRPSYPRPKAVFRFADKDSVILSGMITGGEELGGKVAVAECEVGRGKVFLFSINPFWRGMTVGSYRMILNIFHEK